MNLDKVRSSIVLRTTLLVLGVAFGVGLLATGLVGKVAQRYEADQSLARVSGLLAVVEPSASAACFVRDERLAQETAMGLLNSPSIALVEIRSSGRILARAQRLGGSPTAQEIARPLPSPFDRERIVGEIRVFPDAQETARSVARYVWVIRGLVLLMAVGVGFAVAGAVMSTVVHPIKALSDRLAGMDAYRGQRLEFPPGHEKDEIGRLVTDVNLALEAVEQKHRLEQQIKDAHAQKIDSLGSLAGGVAHDFNNMLGGIMAYADLLLSQESNPRHQKYLQNILQAARRSSELTAKLLAFGRRGKNRAETVPLRPAVEECLSILRPSMSPDLRVVSRLDRGHTVAGDPGQIQQVLMNLCLNAIEAMPGLGILDISSRAVRLEAEEAAHHRLAPGQFIQIDVADTGTGIASEVLPRIFEPFYTTKTRDGEMGTGLGLSTVYGIVEAHQGTIEVASRPGAGTTFTVFLPAGGPAPEDSDSSQVLGDGRGLVLVVEDEPILRDVAQSALESLGFTVALAENGRAGVAAFASAHRDLVAVLLDLKMPVLGGTEAFSQMRAIDESIPIVICTGFGENEEVQDLLGRGAAGLLSKPYRILDLSNALQKLKGIRKRADAPDRSH